MKRVVLILALLLAVPVVSGAQTTPPPPVPPAPQARQCHPFRPWRRAWSCRRSWTA
jgi:hypothetical protein